MRRLPRILLNAATSLSLVLCVAAAGLWARSGVRHDTWSRGTVQVSGAYWMFRRAELHSTGGRLILAEVDERHLPLRPGRPAPGATLRSLMDDQLPWAAAAAAAPPRLEWSTGRDRLAPPLHGHSSRQGSGAATSRVERTRWSVPYPALVAASAALPLAHLTARLVRAGRARRRADSGLCPACGYDLRATPDRCPECGTIPGR
jgi:hypothetical protein